MLSNYNWSFLSAIIFAFTPLLFYFYHNPTPHFMIKIAIADDQSVVREGLASLLGKMGFDVMMQAGNGAELLHKLERSEELPHICMMDLNMPVMDGFATTEAITKYWPEIKVLVVTVYTEDLYITRLIHSGARGYVCKDANAEQYREAILNVYHRGLHYTETAKDIFVRATINGKDVIPKLNATEIEIVRLCCAEYTTNEIAAMLHNKPKNIEHYRTSIFRKLEVKSVAGLAIKAVKYGYVLVNMWGGARITGRVAKTSALIRPCLPAGRLTHSFGVPIAIGRGEVYNTTSHIFLAAHLPQSFRPSCMAV